jgi:hypothetical protein
MNIIITYIVFSQTYHGTVSKLRECLQVLRREDAVDLIDQGEAGGSAKGLTPAFILKK